MSALDEKALGRRLQAARQSAGLTQQTLCQKSNLSYSTLAKIERGAIKTPSIFTIQSIASALGVSIDELLGVSAAKDGRKTRRMKNGASFIYFDVNGCLVHFFQRGFAQLAEDANVAVDAVEAAFWHYNDDACRGTMSLDDFNAAMAHALGLKSLNWENYYLDAVEPIPEMQDLLRWAAERYRVGLLTNIMPGFVSAMRDRGLIPDISYDAIVESSQVGAIKPEAAMFAAATKESGVPASEILLIDDSRPNLTAAESAGWHVLWFDGYNAEEGIRRFRPALEPQD